MDARFEAAAQIVNHQKLDQELRIGRFIVRRYWSKKLPEQLVSIGMHNVILLDETETILGFSISQLGLKLPKTDRLESLAIESAVDMLVIDGNKLKIITFAGSAVTCTLDDHGIKKIERCAFDVGGDGVTHTVFKRDE